MSTAHAARPSTHAIRTPPVLPVITMTIATNGTMSVAVDGTPLEPPRFGPPWVRASFAEIIDTALHIHGSPVRVVVHETDGTVFTDLITQPLTASVAFAPPHERRGGVGSAAEPVEAESGPFDAPPLIAPRRVIVVEEGFLAGEDVAVAVIARHIKASADGSARAMLEPGLSRISADGEVVLVGRVSGTCVFGVVE